MKNYIKGPKDSLFSYCYAYIDLAEPLADEIFIQEKVCVRFGDVGRLKDEDSPYRVVLCKIYKWDEKKFLRAMKRLEDIVLMSGHAGYLEFMEKIVRKMGE